jgi:hypothetical protein
MLDSVTSDENVFFLFQKKEQKNLEMIMLLFSFFFEIIKSMIRTIVRYLTTTRLSNIPKPLAPNKPKASIDFVSEEWQYKDLCDIFLLG